MKTRMEKYYEPEKLNTPLRENKNKDLYENINKYEDLDYKVGSNATIIDNNAQNIDVEQIKKILDTRYKREPKRRSIVLEETDEDIDIIVLIYAEEYYKNNLVELGNRLMDRYSKSPNKTLKTILIYESILNKKNNYLNENRKGKGLALNRIPK